MDRYDLSISHKRRRMVKKSALDLIDFTIKYLEELDSGVVLAGKRLVPIEDILPALRHIQFYVEDI